MNTPELETLLRAAPRPAAPAGLQERLTRQVRLPSGVASTPPKLRTDRWIRRWWPTLAFGGGILACAATLVTQQAQLRSLRAQFEALPGAVTEPTNVEPSSASALTSSLTAVETSHSEDKRVEMARLRMERVELQSVADRIQQLTAENRQLQADLAVQPGISTEDLEAMKEAKARAQSIACVNNLKNIGLAIRIWEVDDKGVFPPDFLSVSNELSTPKILVCPADSGRQAAADWASFSTAHLSYEYLAPGGSSGDPSRVVTRCPIHGNIGLCDGSVQRSTGDGSNITRRLFHRDGKLYYSEE